MTENAGRHNPEFEAISDWLIEGALGDVDLEAQFLAFSIRLCDAGIPLLRAHLATRSLHPLFVAATATWERERMPDRARIPPEDDNGEDWQKSPLFALLQSGDLEARHRLTADGDWQGFPFLTELRERGATDYYAQIVMFGALEQARARQDGCILSWTSDHADGFSDDHIAALQRLGTRFGVIAKLDRREQTAINVVSAYLGADAGRRVLDGQIKLGDGEVINAVIWYSDLRRSTTLADNLPGDEFLDALNNYFACTAGAVLDHGGEVLRFIGDAVLAIFHVEGVDGRTRAARVALAAARDAERRLLEINAGREASGKQTLDFGLALHMGELMFGNIGVPERVEFSVIGPAANEVARLENLTKELGRRVLVSEGFASLLHVDWQGLGAHRVAGVEKAMIVFAPPDK